jgi:hypothetical protein
MLPLSGFDMMMKYDEAVCRMKAKGVDKACNHNDDHDGDRVNRVDADMNGVRKALEGTNAVTGKVTGLANTANIYKYPHLTPSEVRRGATPDDTFNHIQHNLVTKGVVPLDAKLEYWLTFLVRQLTTPEMGIKVAITEIATHAKSYVDNDCTLIPNILVNINDTVLPACMRMVAESS